MYKLRSVLEVGAAVGALKASIIESTLNRIIDLAWPLLVKA